MMLWPVTAELLRATAAGKQVAALKQHPDPQVRNASGFDELSSVTPLC
jgi:hypothetical protein